MPIRWRCGHGGPDVKFEEIGKVTLEMTTHVGNVFDVLMWRERSPNDYCTKDALIG